MNTKYKVILHHCGAVVFINFVFYIYIMYNQYNIIFFYKQLQSNVTLKRRNNIKR